MNYILDISPKVSKNKTITNLKKMEYTYVSSDKIEEILTEKSAAGVEIKIIFDDFGSIKRQYKDFGALCAKHCITRRQLHILL